MTRRIILLTGDDPKRGRLRLGLLTLPPQRHRRGRRKI